MHAQLAVLFGMEDDYRATMLRHAELRQELKFPEYTIAEDVDVEDDGEEQSSDDRAEGGSAPDASAPKRLHVHSERPQAPAEHTSLVEERLPFMMATAESSDAAKVWAFA
jgi:hypothetical protein